jgi:hypothetical protein
LQRGILSDKIDQKKAKEVMMNEFYIVRLVNLLSGVIGLAVAVGMILVPHVVSKIDKKLDKEFPTEKLEKVLNERKNLSEVLLKHPRIFGFILLAVSFLLLLSGIQLF